MPRVKRTDRPKKAEPGPLKLSTDERALVARLIRVRRNKDDWMGYFIAHLLHMDAANGDYVTIKQAQAALEVMRNFVTWTEYFDKVAEECPELKDFPGLEWYPWDDLRPAGPTVAQQITEKSFTRKEQLENELREIKAQLNSPRTIYREAATEYARRLGDTLDRIESDNRRIEGPDGDED